MICTPSPDSTVSSRHHADEHRQRVPEDRQQGAQPAAACDLVGALAASDDFQPVFDGGLGKLPHEVGDEDDDDAVQEALHEALDPRTADESLLKNVGQPGDGQADHSSARAAHH